VPDRTIIKLVLGKSTEWRELNVVRGERSFVELSVLQGSGQLELVPFGRQRLRNVDCYSDDLYTRCEFTPSVTGALGVAIVSKAEHSEAILEQGTVK
jgi:hypothetical protein